jgi:phytoene desaturase
VAALVALFEQLGGELRLSAPVRHIEVDRPGGVVHRVTTDAGATEMFDLVVSNADVHHTYAVLYGGDPRAQRTARRLERLDWSMSLFVLYYGTDRTYENEVVHHTVTWWARARTRARACPA